MANDCKLRESLRQTLRQDVLKDLEPMRDNLTKELLSLLEASDLRFREELQKDLKASDLRFREELQKDMKQDLEQIRPSLKHDKAKAESREAAVQTVQAELAHVTEVLRKELQELDGEGVSTHSSDKTKATSEEKLGSHPNYVAQRLQDMLIKEQFESFSAQGSARIAKATHDLRTEMTDRSKTLRQELMEFLRLEVQTMQEASGERMQLKRDLAELQLQSREYQNQQSRDLNELRTSISVSEEKMRSAFADLRREEAQSRASAAELSMSHKEVEQLLERRLSGSQMKDFCREQVEASFHQKIEDMLEPLRNELQTVQSESLKGQRALKEISVIQAGLDKVAYKVVSKESSVLRQEILDSTDYLRKELLAAIEASETKTIWQLERRTSDYSKQIVRLEDQVKDVTRKTSNLGFEIHDLSHYGGSALSRTSASASRPLGNRSQHTERQSDDLAVAEKIQGLRQELSTNITEVQQNIKEVAAQSQELHAALELHGTEVAQQVDKLIGEAGAGQQRLDTLAVLLETANVRLDALAETEERMREASIKQTEDVADLRSEMSDVVKTMRDLDLRIESLGRAKVVESQGSVRFSPGTMGEIQRMASGDDSDIATLSPTPKSKLMMPVHFNIATPETSASASAALVDSQLSHTAPRLTNASAAAARVAAESIPTAIEEVEVASAMSEEVGEQNVESIHQPSGTSNRAQAQKPLAPTGRQQRNESAVSGHSFRTVDTPSPPLHSPRSFESISAVDSDITDSEEDQPQSSAHRVDAASRLPASRERE
eukprot:TRINITY_DN5870_c0_g1_i2.p1 TRINITY_DN5870_c0_g1~~TRINITY_DN5870_c0_g1_i2.p1  ORF type:complete len:797 (-),score=175.76 TRINITY_DN5870_c0_g1_i2:95-2428(-)